MRPINKWRTNTNNVKGTYDPYGGAKLILLANFGNEPNYFCNYCDRNIPGVNLEVEHVQPVKHYPDLEFSWVNFLIACKNCNLAKLDYNLEYQNIVVPHYQNTFNCFEFNNDGTISVPPHMVNNPRIAETIRMLGFDRGHGHPDKQPQDDRYDIRRQTLFTARKKLKQYEEGRQDIDDIVEMAITTGFWAVWMNVFKNHEKVQNALIESFTNTFENALTTNLNRE